MSCFILRDHCGVWRIIVAISLLSGVLILSRPESLFSPASSTNTTNTSHNSGNHHRDPHDGSYEAVGLMSAVSVPFLSALIVIITRSVVMVLTTLHYRLYTAGKLSTCTTRCWCSGSGWAGWWSAWSACSGLTTGRCSTSGTRGCGS